MAKVLVDRASAGEAGVRQIPQFAFLEGFMQIKGWIRKNLFISLCLLGVMLWFLWTLWATYRADNTGFESKTLWDWMELLIIPLSLAVGVWWLNKVEKRTELKIANDRLLTDRQIAYEQLQETTIQVYLDRMTTLLLDAKLRESKDGDEVRSIARSRTLTVIRSLDATRKGALLRFLYESDLINASGRFIYLKGAELNRVILEKANLRWCDLSWANLRDSTLTGSLLHGANLTGAQLSNTNLEWAKLPDAILKSATLTKANLSLADLSSSNLQDANLEHVTAQFTYFGKANLHGANLSFSNLSNAYFCGANLTRAILDNANLSGINFTNANLTGASLKNADMTGANLEGAYLDLVDLTSARVDYQQLNNVKSITIAIMPDGKPNKINRTEI